MKDPIARYLNRRADLARRPLVTNDTANVNTCVVIPCLRERETLPHTLQSLATNANERLSRTLVVCVVNQSSNTDDATRENTRATLDYLNDAMNARSFGALRLACIDAATPGRGLASKEGVGMARKIGMDWAVEVLRQNTDSDGAIVSLDADTIVDTNYLAAVHDHFTRGDAWAATIAFAHPIQGTERERAAIVWYETFLRYWTLGLHYANSPYAFHSIGSAIACTPTAYAAAGGMNRRRAGEDFYFLNELAKAGAVNEIRDTVVHPAARVSDRVPFGTGRRMRAFTDDDPNRRAAYHPETFEVLRQWLHRIRTEQNEDGYEILSHANQIAPPLAEFLEAQNLPKTWTNLANNAPTFDALVQQRMRWFDAFRTLKCLHHLRDNGYPDQPLFESVATLLNNTSIPTQTIDDQINLLTHLREIQGGTRSRASRGSHPISLEKPTPSIKSQSGNR